MFLDSFDGRETREYTFEELPPLRETQNSRRAVLHAAVRAHHPIRLCDNRPENNGRPVYSWVMNNLWETNFKMDLSGFCSFQYALWLSDETDPEQAMAELHERTFDPYPLITG